MKRVAFFLWLSVSLVTELFAQDYGIQWIQGPTMGVMDFRTSPINFREFDNDSISAFIGTANICDKDGNFMFFTNGIYVRDRNGNLMPNGDSLSFDPAKHSAFNSIYNAVYPSGSPSDQSVLVLPNFDIPNQYLLFHYLTIDTSYLVKDMVINAPLKLYYSVIDMSQNFGLGAVIKKNIRLPINQAMCSSKMTAVRHGNGRDWWLIRHGARDSTYIKFLITPDTILGPYFQQIGRAFNYNDQVQDYAGNSVFNATGDRMASCNFWGPIVVLDFDRCSGEFSNPLIIHNKLEDTTWSGAAQVAFSPSGHYLYANNTYGLNQYDLYANNPNDSVRLYTRDSLDPYWLRKMQLGPDGKLYIAKHNGGSYALHVIHQPDSAGFDCNFEFNGQQCLTANTVNLPNMVNYKLGALNSSGCDTLISGLGQLGNESNLQLSLIPNPATDVFKVSTNLYLKNAVLQITNTLGQQVYTNPNFYLEEAIDASLWQRGVYLISLSGSGKKHTKKLILF